jgi:hypothetical protein
MLERSRRDFFNSAHHPRNMATMILNDIPIAGL